MSADIQTIFYIAAIGMVVAMLHTVLKTAGKEDIAHWVTLVGILIILVMVMTYVGDLFSKIRSVFQLN